MAFGGETGYSLQIPADEVYDSIHRSRNIDQDLNRTVRYTSSTTPPALIETNPIPARDGSSYTAAVLVTTRDGDVWYNETNDKHYKAAILDKAGTPTLFWIED